MLNNHSGPEFYKCISNLIYDSTEISVKKLREKRLELQKQPINVFTDAMINEETTTLSATLTSAFTYLRLVLK